MSRVRKCAMKHKEIVAAGGAHYDGGVAFGLLGIVFAVLGATGDAVNITLGLESISWFLLAIFAGLFAISCWIPWAVAVHLAAIEVKSEKEK